MVEGGRFPLRAVALLSLLALFASAWPSTSRAALESVSGVPNAAVDPEELTEVGAGGSQADVAFSLSHGFPLWFKDENGLKLELCLDGQVALPGGGAFFPCISEEPFPGTPVSFPSNFGPEAFYWIASAAGTFESLVNGVPVVSRALLVLAQEAAFATGLTVDGEQVAFGRIRLRVDAPVNGTYRITHPYGEATYVVQSAALGDDREINQTQDIGNLAAPGAPPVGNFLLALLDGPDPATVVLPPEFPIISAGIVSEVATGIGPFLVPDLPFTPITGLNGSTYLADPGVGDIHLEVPVRNGPFGNRFRIELLDPPEGVVLNAANGSQVVEFDRFQVAGKIFDDGPNRTPVAAADVAATLKGASVLVDVVANDADPIGAGNAHGLNPRAIALPGATPGTYVLTRAQLTQRGGVVRRFTDLRTGKSSFRYTPPSAEFTGVDTFRYVVQDTGGLVSAPATVQVIVEDLAVARAEYRPRTGKWRVSGTSSDADANTVALYAGPRARLSAASGASTAAAGAATLRLSPEAIDYRIDLSPLPSTAVTQVHLHVVMPGQGGNGPPVFTLYDRVAPEPPFTGTKSGTVTDDHRLFGTAQIAAGIGSIGDVIAAILRGDAYVAVHTEQPDVPGAELRGALVLPEIGASAVDATTGEWSFAGKSTASPGRAPASVNARSANGVWNLGVALEVR